MDTWETLRQVYSAGHKIDPVLVDYIAVSDILRLCCEGCSNAKIASITDNDIYYVENTLREFLDFDGLSYDLNVNFRNHYKRNKYNKYQCIACVKQSSYTVPEKDLLDLFRINGIYDNIEKKVEEYYARC